MDRVEGGIAQRRRIDSTYLSNTNITLYIPSSAVMQIKPTPSQLSRLHGFPGGAKIIQVKNGSLSGVDVSSLVGRNFDMVDMIILQTAKERGLPLLTTQASLQGQVFSNIERRVLWGSVIIIRP
jgi:hypothetical protein